MFYIVLPTVLTHRWEYLAVLSHNGCIVAASCPNNPPLVAATYRGPPANLVIWDNNYPWSAPLFITIWC